ncbi:unnamed protein product [Mesocestoides corti]|uniref:FAS1 domain-containing protein n=1 Tax=Mesocestoides corti TaxID=53468 RepID=A0A158QS42_MESCO|nr:unnamed protein product [Mesocestoides corti]
MRGGTRIAILSFVLLLEVTLVWSQALSPNLPSRYERKEYGELFRGVNLCAYKQVLQPNGTTVLAWICGLVDAKSKQITYDCCPGYKRTPLVNNECVEKSATYMPIIPTLLDMGKIETADIFQKVEPALDLKTGKDFTVFVPQTDSATQTILERDIKSLVVDGRHYSGDFANGATIMAKNGYPLKFSTYPNGLVFVECQLLMKPDFETSNGLIHVTSSPIDASEKYGSVLQRLQSDPDLSAFVADIPSDLRSQLSSANSKERFTVFAPNNNAWRSAKYGINDAQGVNDLVRQHVLDGLTCGLSLDPQKRRLGPSKLNTYVRGMEQPDGTRALEDACGNRVTFQKMDMMAGNGVVHKFNSALQSPGSMDFRGVLNCLANGPDSNLKEAARQMASCGIEVQPGDDTVVLLPTTDALREASGMLSRHPCNVYQNHVLTSRECKMKNGNGIGVPQECLFTTKYTSPDGRHPTVTNQYIPTREGSKLHFGKAETTGTRPIPFRGGVIYPVSSLNPPPTQTMIEVIRSNPDLRSTFEKMQKADFPRILNGKSPNVVFFAPLNHGWITRNSENAYGQDQLRKLFEMHTIPHQLITGRNGNIEPETVQTLRALSGTDIRIKRTLDGSTYIGHDDLDPNHWALAIGDPVVASDGIVWVVDWPLVCNHC